jgi:mono/diheme cytochrome c family protein
MKTTAPLFIVALLLATAMYCSANETDLQKILALPPYIEPQFKNFTPIDGDWTPNANDGSLSVAASEGPKLLCSLEPFKNLTKGEVSVEIFFPPEKEQGYRNAGIILKVREAGVGADNFIGYEIAPSVESQNLTIGLHKHNFRKIADVPCTVPAGQWITLHVLFDETSFEVRLDGKVLTKYNVPADDDVRSGGIALRAWHRTAQYRNLKIKKANDDWQTISFQMMQPTEEEQQWSPTLSTEHLPPVLFFTRHPLSRPYSVGNDIWMARPTAPGCSIRIVHPAQPDREIQTIFSDPLGSIYDMNLSADAKTIYFSYRQQDDRYWHLWQIATDGTGLRQLTTGDFHDISPCETPGGDLIFVSTRRFGYTVCQPGPSSNLHRLQHFAPGETPLISCVSMNTLSDFSPQMMRDGRILFTRWEYVDRDLTFRQSLWTQNPDGTGYQLFFGNTIRDVGTFWQARQLPEQKNVLVATFAPHHGFPHGMIGLIDRSAGIEGEKGKGFVYITKDIDSIQDHDTPWGYRDPFPLTDELFLCSYGSGRGYYQDGKKRFALHLLDKSGKKRLLFEDAEQSCFFPMPLVPTEPAAVMVDRVQRLTPPDKLTDRNDKTLTGTIALMDVNEGLQGLVERGTIKSLRIMEQIRKTEELVDRAYDQSPVMSYATYYAKRDWGTVPIEADGSAHFTVPALREIYLQALDSEGREVFRMTSALQVMPGERISCIGCHENRDVTPMAPNRVPLASRKPPHIPTSPDWLLERKRLNEFPDAQVFDYPSVVQPVLDKYCVECHNGKRAEGGYDLTGDKTRYFSMSYDNLLGTSRSYRQHDMTTGKMLPQEVAKGKPLVHFFWLLYTPTSINEPYITGSYASRLTELIESEHGGQAMPLEERQKIYYWIDANVPYYGTYAHSRPKSPGRRDRFADPVSGKLSEWGERFLDVYQRRCTDCHGAFRLRDQAEWTGQYAWVNLSEPVRSAALTAHLPSALGGRNVAAVKGGKRTLAESPEQLLFTSAEDSDYQKMLNAFEEGKRIMLAHPEADMPNFRQSRAEP